MEIEELDLEELDLEELDLEELDLLEIVSDIPKEEKEKRYKKGTK